ncbi:DUF3080 family protein [Paraglaciecola sp.]|uniref:DUF3080 family protein n=1 Tax=Paraglaciecola sp. TaxID=1920173 RepID=UPI003EFB2206
MLGQKIIAVILVGYFCSSCSKNASLVDKLDDYQARLSNVLSVENQLISTIVLAPYPTKSGLTLPIHETKIKLFEFYKLKHCRLYSIIAQRNTTLGKVQLPSTRYLYESELIQAINECINATRDEQLVNKLNRWLKTKKQNYPYVWGHMIQQGNEFKYGLSSNQNHIKGDETDGLAVTLNALHYLLNIQHSQIKQSQILENHLQQFQHYALPAKLWLSQKVLSQHLRKSTHFLIKNSEGLICDKPKDKIKIEYLTNIFYRYFIKEIQPIASKVNQYHYQLEPIFTQLVQLEHLSKAFKLYIKQYNELGIVEYQDAISRHIQFWQNLQKRCNIPIPKQV